MNFRFPYWWLDKDRVQTGDFAFSAYLIKRHALTQAKNGTLTVTQTPDAPGSLPDGDKALEWLYQLLSILDSKASALMRLNGVMLAAAAFMLNPQYQSLTLVKSVVALSATGSTLSIVCCLLVVSVDWPFLSLVSEKNNHRGEKELDFSAEFFHLQSVADFRQKLYRAGWTVSLISAFAFMLAIVVFFCSQF